MLSGKKMTKLLDAGFRKRLLSEVSEARQARLMAADYAEKVVAECAKARNMDYAKDKKSYYGFQPVYFLCAVFKDGTVDKKLFEFKTVNHLIREGEMEGAREAVRCVLLEWAEEDRRVECFDPEKIEAELAKIEAEYAERRKSEGKADDEVVEEAVQP